MEKNKQEAMKLLQEVKTDKSEATAEVIEKMTRAQNLCPHTYIRDKERDTDILTVWVCTDCSNDNYIQEG